MLVRRDRRRRGLAAMALLVGALVAPSTVAEAAPPVPSTGTMKDLGTLSGGTSSTGRAINDRSQVVGSADTADGNNHAFLWSASEGMQDLGTLGGGATSLGQAINDQGQVAGYGDTTDGSTHAFLWTPTP